DGGTHHGAYDLAYMRCIPNMIVSAPMDEAELRHLMYTAQLPENTHPFSIRYPRGQGVMPEWRVPVQKLEIGKGRRIQDGEDIAILTIGHVGNFAVQACRMLMTEDLRPAHYDMRFVKPIDEVLLHEVAQRYRKIITVEDGTIIGGMGSAVLEFMSKHGYHPEVHMLGIPDRVIEHGKPEELHHECGYDTAGIVDAVRALSSVRALSH
ncbi:MAG: 1-deoxy-D-xylulose-5-phosphate synthase, partial [Chitinophagaceae bacterium]|nr:1-deoxy-D-xylulose-5-phosphate synthase [Chitinophagaceae bacterium]